MGTLTGKQNGLFYQMLCLITFSVAMLPERGILKKKVSECSRLNPIPFQTVHIFTTNAVSQLKSARRSDKTCKYENLR